MELKNQSNDFCGSEEQDLLGVFKSRNKNNFTHHPPKDGQVERYLEIRETALKFADFLLEKCPESRERSIALTKLEEAVFWANAAIARNE
jgi:hypothetical protein